MDFGRTCGDNPNVLATPRIDHHEQTARRTHSESDKPLLARVGVIICDGDGVRIIKDRNRFGHPYAVLANVDSSFALLIPFEAHDFSVRTFCAYVKRKAASLVLRHQNTTPHTSRGTTGSPGVVR